MSQTKRKETQDKLLEAIEHQLQEIVDKNDSIAHSRSVVVKNLARAYYDLEAQ